ncbi:MAG: hypothetical protein CMP39_07665 [Rickettsiales bacterium]|nr:hypothetical protein [Rickettsiales bacterium]|tara:strand:+ start:6679 stop:7449 length:771 start_codon:yes stop_codon:yes gene_type:complete
MIITFEQVVTFLLVFARFTGLMIYTPLLKNKNLISMGKLALAFWSTTLVIFLIPLPEVLPSNLFALFLATMVDFLIGVMMGFASGLLIASVESAGTLMDTQAGLSAAAVLDPASGTQQALLGNAMNQLATLLFLLLYGHHLVIGALFESFYLIPIGTPVDFTEGSRFLVTLGYDLFFIAFQLAAPIVLVVFIIDFAFGILNRVAEQINVFQLGFQVKPIISVIILLGIMPGLSDIIVRLIDRFSQKVNILLNFLVN